MCEILPSCRAPAALVCACLMRAFLLLTTLQSIRSRLLTIACSKTERRGKEPKKPKTVPVAGIPCNSVKPSSRYHCSYGGSISKIIRFGEGTRGCCTVFCTFWPAKDAGMSAEPFPFLTFTNQGPQEVGLGAGLVGHM